MSQPAVQSGPSPDDRGSYPVAETIVQTVARLSDELCDEDAVWQAFGDWKGGGHRDYINAIRRTGHSIFLYLLVDLCEFAAASVPPEMRDQVWRIAGRDFSERILVEDVHAILEHTLSEPSSFQDSVAAMVQRFMYRHTADRYELTWGPRGDGLALTVTARDPDALARYFAQYGLVPARCYAIVYELVAGAIEGFLNKTVHRFDTDEFRLSLDGATCVMEVPILKDGRFNFDWIVETLLAYIRRIERRKADEVEDERQESNLIVGSAAMRRTWDRIGRASRSNEIVLLRGESGTGKSFIARKIHELSGRADQPFIEVGLTADVGADNLIQSDLFGHEKGAYTGAHEQKQGLFSLAHGGTIFLDEIGDASPELQSRLLRVIESSTFKRLGGVKDIKVDVRIIAATNRNLEEIIAEGTFRQDLYYRINVIPIELPALRERPEDIPALVDFLLARAGRRRGDPLRKLAPSLAPKLQRYDWPGNIRELDHALKHALAMGDGDTLALDDFPDAVRAFVSSGPIETSSISSPMPSADDDVINLPALRTAIAARASRLTSKDEAEHDNPAHIEYAKRTWLSALIDHFSGDLALVARFWDRSSEKTLRKLIRAYGLSERLDAARTRGRSRKSD